MKKLIIKNYQNTRVSYKVPKVINPNISENPTILNHIDNISNIDNNDDDNSGAKFSALIVLLILIGSPFLIICLPIGLIIYGIAGAILILACIATLFS